MRLLSAHSALPETLESLDLSGSLHDGTQFSTLFGPLNYLYELKIRVAENNRALRLSEIDSITRLPRLHDVHLSSSEEFRRTSKDELTDFAQAILAELVDSLYLPDWWINLMGEDFFQKLEDEEADDDGHDEDGPWKLELDEDGKFDEQWERFWAEHPQVHYGH